VGKSGQSLGHFSTSSYLVPNPITWRIAPLSGMHAKMTLNYVFDHRTEKSHVVVCNQRFQELAYEYTAISSTMLDVLQVFM